MHDKDRDVFKRHETTQNRMRTRKTCVITVCYLTLYFLLSRRSQVRTL
nr:MAG TPA: hypothetical protein [Caudoviricetes sp.]